MIEKRVKFPDLMFEALEKEASERNMTDTELVVYYVRRGLNQDSHKLPPIRDMKTKERETIQKNDSD